MRLGLMVLAILFSLQCFAAHQVVPKWGFDENVLSKTSGDQLGGLEYLWSPWDGSLLLKMESGVWVAKGEGERSSFYAAPAIGYRLNNGWGPFFESYLGAGYISAVDAKLGGHVQLFSDMNFGVMDAKGWGLSVGFKHISNFGLKLPNEGRDFLAVRLLIPIK